MHYVPHVDYAFLSVEHIMRDVNNGWFFRYIHANGASMMFIALYVHMFKHLYYGSYMRPRQILWLSGILIFFLTIIIAFMGYVLPWGQMSFWGATVITNLVTAIPVLGKLIVNFLWGGFAVDNPTLNRFLSLHFLFPFYAILRSIPDKLGGVLAMGGSFVVLAILPWLTPKLVIKSSVFRPITRILFWFILVDFILLGWIGQNVAEYPFIQIGQFLTIFYFLYFVLLLPVLSYFEYKSCIGGIKG